MNLPIGFCFGVGHNWVDPPQRERKRRVNYAENEYFRNALKQGGRGPTGPRLPKMPVLQDFQFFNTARITELIEKQHAYELFLHEKKREAAEKKVVVLHSSSFIYFCTIC